ncbi:TMEM175 family protein [Amycolatopsis sp. H20-H5]|uniref:TMEM175 family protein n=1 Tax=Amycolatopsis sp. H20-H5 TaxID=3046309 RepID=UPI002DB62B5C|nr:TMEM175 family protein [Amycolatopsis sp. H20-H5]MEC3980278.1 TMEM175 family protein [Amycolatopsis sp. H20-H5]
MDTHSGRESADETSEARAVAAARLPVFVDAVIAIALTLLALDLPVPTGATTGAMLDSVLEHRSEYLAFVVSFLVVGAHWHAHHEIFCHVRALSGRLTGLTLFWLFLQVLMPFATRVLTADGAFPARFGLYALVQVLASASFALIIREIRRQHLYREDVPPRMFAQSQVRSLCLAAVFAVSIPVAFLTANGSAYLCWIAVPIVLSLAQRVQSRAAAARPAPRLPVSEGAGSEGPGQVEVGELPHGPHAEPDRLGAQSQWPRR